MIKKKSARVGVFLTIIVILGMFNSRAEAAVDDQFKYAKALYENECFFPAIVQFTYIINTSPDSKHVLESNYLIGECLQGEKKYWRAMKHWKEVSEKYPDSATAKKCDEGIRMIKRVIEVHNFGNMTEKSRYPVTIKDFIAKTFSNDFTDHQGRMVIDVFGEPNLIEPEFNAGGFWSDKILSYCQGAEIAVDGQVRKGDAYFVKNTPKDCRKSIEEYLKIMDLFPNDFQWIFWALQRCAQVANDNNRLGDSKYAAELYLKLIKEAEQRIGQVSYYKEYARTQLRIMGKKID